MEILRKLRKEKKATQLEVAKYLGITVSAYGNYELGQRQPNPEMLQKLADFFDVSVDYLLGRTQEKSPQDYPEGFSYEDFLKMPESNMDPVFNGLHLSEIAKLPPDQQDLIFSMVEAMMKSLKK